MFYVGRATWEACSGNLEPWKPSQHSLLDTGKPRKICVEVVGRRTFWVLTSTQQYTIIITADPSVNTVTRNVFSNIDNVHIKLAATSSTPINSCAIYWVYTLLFSCTFSLALCSPRWWLRRAETCTRKQHIMNDKTCRSDFKCILLNWYVLILPLYLQK
jgi:hypothetical protein